MSKNNNSIKECYGKLFDKLEKCEKCEERAWCKDAGDPHCSRDADFVNSDDDSDDITPYDKLLNSYAEKKEEHEEIDEVSLKVAEIIKTILLVSDNRPDRISTLIMRIGGYSYEDMGIMFEKMRGKKTRQAVKKDIDRISKMSPEIGRVIRSQYKSYKQKKVFIKTIVEEYLAIKNDKTRKDKKNNIRQRITSEELNMLSKKYGIDRIKLLYKINNYLKNNKIKRRNVV